MTDLTLIYSLYGTFDKQRFYASILSALNQEDVNLEIIVATQNSSLNDEVKAYSNVKVVEHKSELSEYSPGGIRNTAAKEATTELIYFNDADIVFLNPQYLIGIANKLENENNLSLMRPEMYRLSINEFNKFYYETKQYGIKSTLTKLKKPNKYFMSFFEEYPELKVVKKQDDYLKTFVALKKDFEKYLSDESLKGKEPTIFYENMHIGGIATKKSLFEEVGGYCEDFQNWGCEDSDLQWKLGEKGRIQFIPKKEEFRVLHLDHPKGYFNKEKWKENEEIHKLRRQTSFQELILQDISKYESDKK